MTSVVAIRGVDKELYRRIKAYAALEGRTVGSIVNEALRMWLETRRHPLYDKWRRIQEERKRNYEWLKENYDALCSRHEGKYAVVSGGALKGLYDSFEEAAETAWKLRGEEALIVRVGEPLEREVQLGLPAEVFK